MKFKRRRKNDQGISLTPMIDVVFLLLIFFMVSTTFTKETHLQVELPEADAEAAGEPPNSIEILVARDGSYSVNGRALFNRQVATLVAALQQAAAGDVDVPLVITADANASHQSVVTAMDAAGRAGFIHLSITTRRPEAPDT